MKNITQLKKLARELFPFGGITINHPSIKEMVTDEHTVISDNGEEVATCYRFDDAAETLRELSNEKVGI